MLIKVKPSDITDYKGVPMQAVYAGGNHIGYVMKARFRSEVLSPDQKILLGHTERLAWHAFDIKKQKVSSRYNPPKTMKVAVQNILEHLERLERLETPHTF